jgi:hypothetical protein
MARIRFTIGRLAVVIAFAALAIAALRQSTDLWAGGVLLMSALTLLTSILLIVHRRDAARAYWIGFALFGCVYLIASEYSGAHERLLTTRGLAYLASKRVGAMSPGQLVIFDGSSSQATQAVAFSPNGRTLAIDSGGLVRIWDVASGALVGSKGGSTENFMHIGHCLLALIFALLGGPISRFLYWRNRDPSSAES